MLGRGVASGRQDADGEATHDDSALRCLKRHLAREVFRTLRADLREPQGLDGL